MQATTLFLVDGIDNAVRQAYGRLPNSAYIIGQDGRVFHKQPWMDGPSLRAPLEALLAADGKGGESPPKFEGGGMRPGRRGGRRGPRPTASYKDAPVDIPADAKDEIVWLGDLEKGRTLAREAGVPLLVEFYYDSCSFCAAMAEGPLRDRRVVALSRKFVCVKLSLDTPAVAELADELKLIGTPAFAFYSVDGEVTQKHTSYAEADFVADLFREGLERSGARRGRRNN